MDKQPPMTYHHNYLDALYQEYLRNPNSLDAEWRQYFQSYDEAPTALAPASAPAHVEERLCIRCVVHDIKVMNLINAYRWRGHLFTKTNPVRVRRNYTPNLDLENFELGPQHLDVPYEAGTEIGIGRTTLRQIVAHLQQTYCGTIGAEFMFVREPNKIKWLQNKMESTRNTPQFSVEKKRNILRKLVEAVAFENFLHTKYVGQKRFGLSGMETLIPALDTIIEKGVELGIEEFVLGMAHRGRLNVLANIFQKTYKEIFAEFDDKGFANSVFAGDVKYHKGYSSNLVTRTGKKINMSILPNPSHLEAVDPIVQGVTRAKIDKRYHGDLRKACPIQIHGDAALAGQGIVYEVVQMAQLPGYQTGGTVHIALNNQVGFTTNYTDGRSSIYCTDVAQVTRCPVLHVNSDDVEAVVLALELAMEYRQTFHTDVFIDLLGYRRYGHNEADEPRFTQPKLYKVIETHPDPKTIYCDKLAAENTIQPQEATQMESDYLQKLDQGLERARVQANVTSTYTLFKGDWTGFRVPHPDWEMEVKPETQVPGERLLALGAVIYTIPPQLAVFPKIRKIYEDHKSLLIDKKRCNWSLAETLAYATLLEEGLPVRLSGQDCQRGTFAHRHAVLVTEDTEESYIPLNHIHPSQAKFQIYNSPLSEYGVMGFDFGYAWASPKGLTIWEAQFGDFANGAQIIMDQFLCCSDSKWSRYNGLVVLLPHGYEGQGPEHSSARLERFLSLCSHNNMQIMNCTTPANFFHALRRQSKFPFRIPLVMMTPKSLLRHPQCQSPLEDFANKKFEELIEDTLAGPNDLQRILFCSGKIYYELAARREQEKRADVALVRLEQLYPFPEKRLAEVIQKFKSASQYLWVQEEPENMGAWPFILRKWKFGNLKLVSRLESAAPAVGSYKQHELELKAILQQAFC